MDEAHPVTTLLTIEDDHLLRKAIAAYLTGCGYRILQAGDGREGLELFRSRQPDLVLTDLRLPGLDGMEILARIRRESPDTPVIIVSGMGTRDDVIEALKLGADDYVTKPVDDMVLLEHAVERALEHGRLVRENRRYQERLEEEVQNMTAELHQAQKLEAVGTLAGGIAHDFNNILAAIMGFTELALFKLGPDDEVREDLLQIKKAGERARKLVQQILTFSRKGVNERRPVQASLMIKEALKLLRATLPATVELIEDIRAREEMILMEPTEIHQVVTNLCTNAFHALPEERGRIEVGLHVHVPSSAELKKNPALEKKHYLQLTVRDSGCGMDREMLGRIFDPFFTTKEEGRGTGLGLSVVHGIVTDCGGAISVESAPGQGTCFSLLFPLAPATRQVEEMVVPGLAGGNERILFVDDEEDLRLMATRLLEYLGYDVVCCASGEEVLQQISEAGGSFALLITDQSMPKMPGTELARRVRSTCPKLPILLCTGYSSMVNEEKALAMGLDGFLQKPLSAGSLAREIRRILDSR